MPVLKTSASDFTSFVGAIAQARPAGTTAPKPSKVAVPPKASTVMKVATIILASKISSVATTTSVVAPSNIKVNTTKRG